MASKGGCPLSSGLPNYPRFQLPASHSSSSQWLNCCSLTNSLTQQPTLHFLTVHWLLKSKSKLLYNWQFTDHQFVLAPSPERFMTRDFFFNRTLAAIVLMQHPLWQKQKFLLWTGFTLPLSSLCITHIACYWKFVLVHYIQVLTNLSCLKHLGTDCTENTTPLLCRCCILSVGITWSLLSHCLATDIVCGAIP
jgi:hypothetical protein